MNSGDELLRAKRVLFRRWNSFCNADNFVGRETFTDRMEKAGLIELVPVDDDALEESFAAERGIEKGGMMWKLTAAGSAAYESEHKKEG
ncbi:MAG: hypothetical protein KGO94_14085 [Alphaproteobacteria bacterium]|nr:hypothetical protein [Alphaproteobacteria bacterium]